MLHLYFHLLIILLLILVFEAVILFFFHHHLSKRLWFVAFLLMRYLRKNLGFSLRRNISFHRKTDFSLRSTGLFNIFAAHVARGRGLLALLAEA